MDVERVAVMSVFGHDYKGRKNIPIFSFLTRYFPKALVEVTRVCVAGNAQHNPELPLTDINWARDKSTDQLNTAMRHMIDHATSGPLDEEPPEVLAAMGLEPGESTYHLAKAAWRILAALELEIEARNDAKSKKKLRPGNWGSVVDNIQVNVRRGDSANGPPGNVKLVDGTSACGEHRFDLIADNQYSALYDPRDFP